MNLFTSSASTKNFKVLNFCLLSGLFLLSSLSLFGNEKSLNDDSDENPYTFATKAEVVNEITWTGSTDTDWFDPANWSPNGVPDITMKAIISATTNQPNINAAGAEAKRLEMANNTSLTVGASGVLTVDNTDADEHVIDVGFGPSFNVVTIANSGTINLKYSATSSGSYITGISLGNGSVFTNNSTGIVNFDQIDAGLDIYDGGIVNNSGTMNFDQCGHAFIDAFPIQLNSFSNQTQLNNLAGGTINIDNSVSWSNIYNSGEIHNYDTIAIGANSTSSSPYGIYNVETFNNYSTGVVNVDKVSEGIFIGQYFGAGLATFNNDGALNIGQNVPVSNSGIWMGVSGMLINVSSKSVKTSQGIVMEDNSIIENLGIFEFTNSFGLTDFSSGVKGLFKNNATGEIKATGGGFISVSNFSPLGGEINTDTTRGIIEFNGNMNLANNVFELKIAGTGTAGTDYDQVKVDGTADLDGSVFNVTATYTPTIGDKVQILDANAFTGNFCTGSTLNGWVPILNDPATGDISLVYNPNQEILVRGGVPTITIADGATSTSVADSTDFGSDIFNTSKKHSFFIENGGAANLSITGPITVTGSSDFVVTQPTTTTISQCGIVAFDVTYSHSTVGVQTATISIPNDDPSKNPYDFVVEGTSIGIPEINVQGNNMNIASGSTTISTDIGTDFETITAGSSTTQSFTIQNTGNTALAITSITSGNAAFTITNAPTSVSVSGSSTFDVTFTPTAAGTQSGTITINNDDADEGTYTFIVEGTGTLQPEINLQGNGSDIADGSTTINTTIGTAFGLVMDGLTDTLTYTIQNTGGSPLTINSITSDDAAFTIINAPASVAAASSATFSVVFAPTSVFFNTAEYNAIITIDNDDADEGMYDYAVRGYGVFAPAIDVSGIGSQINNGQTAVDPSDNTDFGLVTVNGSKTHTFDIVVPSDTALIIDSIRTDNPLFTISNAPTSIPSAGGDDFDITFSPTAVAVHSATITIYSNVPGADGEFTFAVQGEGFALPPEINVQGNGNTISSGSTTISGDMRTNYGDADIGTTSTRSFTIQNTGTGALTITNITSSNAHYTISNAPSSIAPNSSATYDVTFTPTTAGFQSTTITIENNDADESLYTYDIRTKAVQPYGANAATVIGGAGRGVGPNQLWDPQGIHIDASNDIYLGDNDLQFVKKWTRGASEGVTVAGGNGKGTGAGQFRDPTDVYVDATGNIFVSEWNGHRVQKWAPGATTGATVAGGNGNGGASNQTGLPVGVFVDAAGNVYVTEYSNHRVTKWAPGSSTGVVVAGGNGIGSGANQLKYPYGVQVDADGNVYVSDISNGRTQKWAPGASTGTTVANGGGVDLYIDDNENIYYVNVWTHEATKWAPGASSGVVFGGIGGRGSGADQLDGPISLHGDTAGNIYVIDRANSRVQMFCPSGCPPAEINVQGNGNDIVDGSTNISTTINTDFETIPVGSSETKHYVIQNTGADALTVSSIYSSNSSRFSIGSAPTLIPGGGSDSISVTFNPSISGTESATITILNEDSNESVYDFLVQGVALALPEINVQGNGNDIASGSSTISTLIGTDLGTLTTGSSTTQSFTIQNTGTTALAITSITCGNAVFTISNAPMSIAVGGSSTFDVTFSPTAAGIQSGTITINNDDADEGTYAFLVEGCGGTEWYTDEDGDMYGGAMTLACTRPIGYFSVSELTGIGDCDDDDANEFPGQTWYIDADSDNYSGSGATACERPMHGYLLSELTGTNDCDDNDANEFPGQTWYVDADGDSYSASGTTATACERPMHGFLLSELTGTNDCDDMDANEFPGQTWYIDADGDSYSASGTTATACERPMHGFLLSELTGTGDCDDADADEFPGQTWYIDADGDSYSGSDVTACERPMHGFLLSELTGTGDCDDADADEFPGQTWYIDADGDSYSASGTTATACERPMHGFLLSELTGTNDCDDADAAVYPGAPELCDGKDNDCNGTTDDGQAPIMTCPSSVDVYVQANCEGAVPDLETFASVTDDCSTTFTYTQSVAIDALIGEDSSALLIVTDDANLMDSCTIALVVSDTVAPVIACPAGQTLNTAAGNCNQQVNWMSPSATDNCSVSAIPTVSAPGVTIFSAPPFEISLFNAGTTTVTYSVMDDAGNIGTCSFDVTINDVEPPTITDCPTADILVDASPSECGALGNWPPIYPSDNCGATMNATHNSGHFFSVGSTEVLYVATDNAGLTDTCRFNVVVSDITLPTAICQDITVNLDGDGIAAFAATDIDNGSWDSCGIANLALDTTWFGCSSHGVTESVTLTVTDQNNNESTCTADVTVQDITDPTAACITSTLDVYLDNAGMASITTADIDDGSADNCGFSMMLDSTDFDCGEIGMNSVVLTVTDDANLSATCSAQVMVSDTVSPSAKCITSTLQLYLDASGMASITTDDIDDGSTDNCTAVNDLVLMLDKMNFNCAEQTTHTVTLTVTDEYSNESMCTASVMVNDTITPAMACRSDVLNVYLDATGNASITTADIDDGSADNCMANLVLSLDTDAFTCADTGMVSVTLMGTDGSNSASCAASLMVWDTISPMANCIAAPLDIFLDASGMASILIADINDGSSDNCTDISMALDSTMFDCDETGMNTVVLSVTDANDNTSTCSAQVNVIDNTNPTADCIDTTYILYLDASGMGSITADDIDDGSFDNCNFSLAIEKNASSSMSGVSAVTFDCSETGMNTVNLTVADASSNTASCAAQVNVIDNTNPTADCIDTTYMLYLDASGMGSITADDIDDGSFDNCSFSLAIEKNTSSSMSGTSAVTFDCSETGMNTVTLAVTDESSNTASCAAQVNVIDGMAPMANCISMPLDIFLDASGMASISTNDIDATSTDNCSIASMVLDSTAFDCDETGMNTVVLTVTDASSNSSTCSAQVNVIDNTNPTADCIDTTYVLYLDASGMGSITADDIDDGSFDNCSFSLAIEKNTSSSMSGTSAVTFDCSETGMNTVNLTVTDASSNTASCAAQVNVIDDSMPTALCITSPLNVYLDANGMASITPSDIDNGSSDNCTSVSMQLDSTMFDCAETGMNTVNLTVTDASSNTASCSAQVNVLDTIAPMNLSCPIDVTGVTNSTSCHGSAGWVLPEWSDNCAVSNVNVDSESVPLVQIGTSVFGTFPKGETIVSYTASDASNNMTVCSFTITVNDVIAPVFVGCPSDVVLPNDPGLCSAQHIWNAPIPQDNCPDFTVTQSHNVGDDFPYGVTTVVYTVMDEAMNSAECSFTVTVQDTEDPVLTCPSDITLTTATGACNVVANFITPTATDNCGATVSHVDGPMSGGVISIGSSSSVWQAIDTVGNKVTCSFSITVQSNDVWYADNDGDGYGDPTVSQMTCIPPAGYVMDSTDCNDYDSNTHPGAPDICDGIDNDCDGVIDNTTTCDKVTNIVVSAGSDTALVTWSSVCSGLSYDIAYRPENNVRYPWIWYRNYTDTSLLLTNLAYGTDYRIRIRTNCGTNGTSLIANEYFETSSTPACVTPVFTGFTATDTSITAQWSDADGEEIVRFYWRELGPSATSWTFINFKNDETSHTVNGLNPDTRYQFRLRTRCSGTWLPFNKNVTYRTLKPAPTSRSGNAISYSLNAYPNPFVSDFTMETDMPGEKTLSILTATGRLLTSWTQTELKFRVDLGDFANGVYFIQLKDDKGNTIRQRMIKASN